MYVSEYTVQQWAIESAPLRKQIKSMADRIQNISQACEIIQAAGDELSDCPVRFSDHKHGFHTDAWYETIGWLQYLPGKYCLAIQFNGIDILVNKRGDVFIRTNPDWIIRKDTITPPSFLQKFIDEFPGYEKTILEIIDYLNSQRSNAA